MVGIGFGASRGVYSTADRLPGRHVRARRRATEYARGVDDPARPTLELIDGRLEARIPGDRAGMGITVDFSSIRFPDGPDSVRGLPLVRACGREAALAGAALLDATAGLGYDAFMLALAGFQVTAVERVEMIARLAEDGVRRARLERPSLAMRVIVGDAREAIVTERPAVVYMDPMYPPKRRASALPPKEMQFVRSLAGDDPDSRELFRVAIAHATRVVVKRPHYAEPFDTPSHSIESKLVRFDVFTRTPSSRPKE
jgi:16S rRNA (guanine1516-N2)-methyltransferase